MSWESVHALPHAKPSGSPYQGAAEPIVARRVGLSVAERVRLFWQSTPEHPASRAPRAVVITPNHLYVERVDGTRQRVTLGALTGRRREGARVIYGVGDGDDLALLARARCPVQAELDARVDADPRSRLEAAAFTLGLPVTLALSGGAALLGAYFLSEYSLEGMWDRIHHGLYTAEVVLGVAAGFACILTALVVACTVPVRWRIDALGVHRVRGIVPLLHYLDPPESFRAVRVRPLRSTQGAPVGYAVLLLPRDDDAPALRVRSFVQGNHAADARAETTAMAFAKQVGRLLGLSVQRGE